VLARKRDRLGLMQAELAALHIPAQQPEKNDLADMPAAQDLVALLDVLVSPAHDLSLARALKSPVFGIDDSDLVQLVLIQRAMQRVKAHQADDLIPPRTERPSWLQVLQQAPNLPAALAPLGERLTLWKNWVDTLPPHDALSAIYHDGDVLARYAAATPPSQRGAVMTHLRALLSAALQVDGGRYSSAYALVRALRAGGTQVPVRADANAVRLLTIHGAKGLEAPLVLLLDTDGEAVRSQSMGVLVDWPGEASHPQRFVFLASESTPPACVADALSLELVARKREELNALYVALTRTQRTLVVSSLEPHSANPASWWQRLHMLAQDAPWSVLPEKVNATESPAMDDYTLWCLPNMPVALVEYDQLAIKTVAFDATDQSTDRAGALEARIGQAMHRLLERYLPRQYEGQRATLATVAQQAHIAQEFTLEPEQMALAHDMALAIVQGEGAWAWDANEVGWQGNEVGLVYHGRLLRIDRLVLRQGPGDIAGQWWVLDYKSTNQPQLQPELREQLLTYRAAVAQAQPGQVVRAAFLTPIGSLIELQIP
jgi:ATP-dependent helicase/nuclease subunit A